MKAVDIVDGVCLGVGFACLALTVGTICALGIVFIAIFLKFSRG